MKNNQKELISPGSIFKWATFPTYHSIDDLVVRKIRSFIHVSIYLFICLFVYTFVMYLYVYLCIYSYILLKNTKIVHALDFYFHSVTGSLDLFSCSTQSDIKNI